MSFDEDVGTVLYTAKVFVYQGLHVILCLSFQGA